MTLFRERIWPAPWLYIAIALVIPATIIVFAPIHPPVGIRWGIAIGVFIYVAAILGILGTSPTLVVTEDEFRAGRASVEREYLGMIEPFTGTEAAAQRGPQLDARAWLLLRGSLPIVKVPINDADDPVPYWIVSTRRPRELARVLNDRRG